jgi:hypothetical protein
MSSKQSVAAKRLERGYYKTYQVDIDSGTLSISLLQKLTSGFENSMRRFPNCYVFRFKLRVPKTYHQDSNKLLNQWFYSLAKQLLDSSKRNFGNAIEHEPITEEINIIWAKDMADDGSVFYRIALFFRAPKKATEHSSLKAKEFFKKKIIAKWAYAIHLDETTAQSLCQFPTANIIPLNPDKRAYNQDSRYCFFILSALARKSRYPADNLDDVFGVKYSRNPNKRVNRI